MLKKRKVGARQASFLPDEKGSRSTQRNREEDFSYGFDDEPAATESAEESARYIADMIASLAHIARQSKFDLLTYLLDMARVEAEMQARQTETPLDEDE
jgi:hypothetical protein